MMQTQDAPGPQSCATVVPDVASRPVTVHITGFEPFGGAGSNASWEAVRLLPETIELAGGSALVDSFDQKEYCQRDEQEVG